MLEKKSLGLLRHTARTLLTGDLHHWQQFGTIFCHVHIRSRSEDATDTFSNLMKTQQGDTAEPNK